MADKPTSASTDDKKFEDMTIFEKVRAKTQEIKEEQAKRKQGLRKPFNPDIGDASTDDPKYPFPSGPPSTGGDGATETAKPQSGTMAKMKRRSDGSMAKLKGQSFMKRMKMMNQASPTRLVQGEHDFGKNKIKDITKTIYDKITKVTKDNKFPNPGTMPSTPPYAPKGGGLNTIKKIKDLFGK